MEPASAGKIGIPDTIGKVKKAIKTYDNLPVGCIVWFGGDTDDLPGSWVVCDGNNGTPDLRNSFMVVAGSTYNPDDTGGSATHTHDSGTLATGTAIGGAWVADVEGWQPTPISHTHDVTTGKTASGNGLPSYHALPLIMKMY